MWPTAVDSRIIHGLVCIFPNFAVMGDCTNPKFFRLGVHEKHQDTFCGQHNLNVHAVLVYAYVFGLLLHLD